MKRGIRQHDTRDCGAACLSTVLLWYGSTVPLVEIRQKMRVDKNGVSLFAICNVAKMFGLDADGYCAKLDELIESIEARYIKLPIIIHTILENNLQHYMVIRKISHKKIYLFDPQKGEVRCSIDELEEIFTGNFISLFPSDRFIPRKRNLNRFRKYIKIITKQKKLFLLAICCSLMSAMASIMASLSYQTIIDKYILNGETTSFEISIFSSGIKYIESHYITLLQLLIAVMTIYLVQIIINGIKEVIITCIYKNSSECLIFLG